MNSWDSWDETVSWDECAGTPFFTSCPIPHTAFVYEMFNFVTIDAMPAVNFKQFVSIVKPAAVNTCWKCKWDWPERRIAVLFLFIFLDRLFDAFQTQDKFAAIGRGMFKEFSRHVFAY